MKRILGYRRNVLFWAVIALFLAGAAAQIFSAAAHLTVDAPLLNEFLASNGTGLTDENGDYTDWIEIYNPTRTAVNLSGWSLTDDPGQPEKWRFPDMTLPAGSYLVVFASGKNRTGTGPEQYLHTNFKLSKQGEFLGLYNILDQSWGDVAAISDSEPSPYPEQFRDISYGRYGDRTAFVYLSSPTPGGPNEKTDFWEGLVSEVEVGVQRGFYEEPFALTLSTATPDAVIKYTLDGSEPTETNGNLYTKPILIQTTTPVRVTAFKPNCLPAAGTTHTYIFLDDVLRQPANPPGFPMTWGSYPKTWRGYTKGEPVLTDYEMDPEVVNDPRYRPTIKDDLKAIPSVSLVTDLEHFSTLYANPRQRGRAWERPVSVEFIDPSAQTPQAQVNAGLRIHGGEVRLEFIPKHAFRLFFRSEYGPTRLEYPLFADSPVDRFDTLVFRGGGGYAGRPGGDKRHVTYLRDPWLRASQQEMSGLSPHGTFVHLYINGLYWGLYTIVERPDASFAASHLGGSEDSWFAANHNGLISGPLDRVQSFQELFAATRENYADPENYAAIQTYLDTTQFIDYIILNWYAGNKDWPDTNWYMDLRSPDGRAQFFVWDGEGIWAEGATIVLGPPSPENMIRHLFESLIQNTDFKTAFADRVYKHLYHDGALTEANSQARWLRLSRQIDRAIVGESARWGDARSDPPITREDWLKARDEVLTQMAGNGDKFIKLLREAGYYPGFDPPIFNRQGGLVVAGFNLSLSLPEKSGREAVVYYTTDGSDPRQPVTGAVAPAARLYQAPFVLTQTTHVKARLLAGDQTDSDPGWSALNEAAFRVVDRDSQVRFTEIMYNPPGGGDYEFIELQNIGNRPVDLSGASFEGIDFTFPAGMTPVAPDEVVLLVHRPDAFARRYPDAASDGIYAGQLSNRGETIILKDVNGAVLASVTYNDENGWPLSPDGRGDSLVLRNPAGDPNDPKSWRASPDLYGSPGRVESSSE